MPSNIPSSSGTHRAQYVPFNVAKVVQRIPLANIRNQKQEPYRCGMSNVTGPEHRNALGFAMSKSQDVMVQASDLSPRQKECIQRTVDWMSSEGNGGIGNIVLQRLAALGASHAAMAELVKETPGDASLKELEKNVSRMIVDLGVAIGRCRTPPQGTALNSREGAVSDLDDAADKCVKACASSIGGQKFMEAIGRVILPEPIMNALVDKRSDLLAKIAASGAASIDLIEVLNARALRAVQNVVNVELDTSSAEAAVTAIIALLEIPELIVEGDPGKEGSKGSKEKGIKDLPPGVQQLAGDGKNNNFLINDFGKMGNKSQMEGAHAAKMAELEVEKFRIFGSYMLDAFKLGVESGRGCGQLITGIHNTDSNASTIAQDPFQPRLTADFQTQANLLEINQQNRNEVDREVHQGSGNVLNGNDEGLGTLHPQPNAAYATPEANPYTRGDEDVVVGNDADLEDFSRPDPSDRVNPHGQENPVGGQEPLDVDADLQRRFDNLRYGDRDEIDAPVRTEDETLRQTSNPGSGRPEDRPDVRDPLDNGQEPPGNDRELMDDFDGIDSRFLATLRSHERNSGNNERTHSRVIKPEMQARINQFEELSKGVQNPVNKSEIRNPVFVPTSSTSQSDDDASSVSSISSQLSLGRRARDITDRDDADRNVPQKGAVGNALDRHNALAAYLESVNLGEQGRIEKNLKERHVMRRDALFALRNPDNKTGIRVAASRQQLNTGALISPSDVVKFLKEEGIVGRRVPQAEPSAQKLEEFPALAKAMREREAEGKSRYVGFKDELKRIWERDGKASREPKSYGPSFAKVLQQAEAFEVEQQARRNLQVVVNGSNAGPAVNGGKDSVNRWLDEQPPVSEQEAVEVVVGKPARIPLAQRPEFAAVRAMVEKRVASPETPRDSLVENLFKPRASEPLTPPEIVRVANERSVRFDPALGSDGESVMSDTDTVDSSLWDHGTPEQLADPRSVELDRQPHFVPVPQPLSPLLERKPTPVVLGERDSMPVHRTGLTPEQYQRILP